LLKKCRYGRERLSIIYQGKNQLAFTAKVEAEVKRELMFDQDSADSSIQINLYYNYAAMKSLLINLHIGMS